jgi:hypothetical protein
MGCPNYDHSGQIASDAKKDTFAMSLSSEESLCPRCRHPRHRANQCHWRYSQGTKKCDCELDSKNSERN